MRERPIRVLHCPNDVAGNPGALARAERVVGLDSVAVALTRSQFNFSSDEVLWSANEGLVSGEARRWKLLLRAIRDFDVVHFNFGQTIMPAPSATGKGRKAISPAVWWASKAYRRSLWLRDLPLLRAAGKIVFVTFQGDDARQGDHCVENFELSAAPFVPPGYYSKRTDRRKRTAISRFDRYADGIYALNPDLLHVLPQRAQFLPYASVDPRDWAPVRAVPNRTPIVLHAPTHRGVKGTEFLVEAAARLKDEGVEFELVLVEHLEHREARRLYESADLVVDQLLVGWYGGFAVEAMALGKPVVSYVRDADLRFVPRQMASELPVIRATPDTIEVVLRSWLTQRRDELPDLGDRSRVFVERWHDPVAIAERVKADYEDAIHRRYSRRRVRSSG